MGLWEVMKAESPPLKIEHPHWTGSPEERHGCPQVRKDHRASNWAGRCPDRITGIQEWAWALWDTRGNHRRITAPQSGSLRSVRPQAVPQSRPRPAGPQTHRARGTAARPAAPGRTPSRLQAACSGQAAGRRGGCGRGSSGAQAWRGEASVRRPALRRAPTTLPFSGLRNRSPPRNPTPGVRLEPESPTPRASTITALSPPGRRGPPSPAR